MRKAEIPHSSPIAWISELRESLKLWHLKAESITDI
jgi:hypothetical protein